LVVSIPDFQSRADVTSVRGKERKKEKKENVDLLLTDNKRCRTYIRVGSEGYLVRFPNKTSKYSSLPVSSRIFDIDLS